MNRPTEWSRFSHDLRSRMLVVLIYCLIEGPLLFTVNWFEGRHADLGVMDIMTIPDEIACLELLEKYSTPKHIVLHSLKVWQVGKILGDGLIRSGYSVDLALVRASCLLHDIGKYPCIVEGGGFHDLRGERILGEEGYPSVGRIVVQHVFLRGGKGAPVAEEHVVYYADKRVTHDEVVSLDARFEYLQQTYGRSPGAVLRVLEMKEEAIRVEREIFRLLDFSPDDIMGLLY